MFGIDKGLYDKMFKISSGEEAQISLLKADGKWSNIRSSSGTAEEETVDEIRHNAPQWFKLGNRLITAADWEYFMKNVFGKSNVIDVKCQNNWGYISTFYRWLYNVGVEQKNNGRYYLT